MRTLAKKSDPDASVVLTIDLGSTNFKAAVYSADLKRLSDSSVPVFYSRQKGGFCELNPERVCAQVHQLCRKTIQAAGLHSTADLPLAVCSQAQTFTIFDSSDRPLIPLISWIDGRAGDEAEELGRRFGNTFHGHCSFPAPLPQLMVCKILWLKKHNPTILQPENRVIGIHNLVAQALCGKIHATDTNIATMNGIYSLTNQSWYSDILEYCGLPPGTLDEPISAGKRIVSDTGNTVMFAGNDQTAGAVANGASADRIIATFGTALVAYRRSGKSPGPYGPSCWGMYPGGGFYELGVRDKGCLALDQACKQLMPDQPLSEFFNAAQFGRKQINTDTGVFYPESTWIGSVGSDAEKAYTVLEGISFSLRDLIFHTMKCTDLQTVTAIGGGSRSDFWMQLTADILNTPVTRGTGDSLKGAAMMFFGHKAVEEETVVFQPNPTSARVLDQRFRDWKENEPNSHPS